MTLRVVVWGPGNVGRPAIRAVAAHRDLELAGVIVHDPAKVGIDAGELARIDPLGVTATNDTSIAEVEGVDALVYSVNADFRPDSALAEVERVLASGVDVVSTAFHGLLHPPSAPESLRSRIGAACQSGNSSILVSGIDPGWVLDVLPLLLSGMSADINEIRIQELANYTGYDQPQAVRDLCGFGYPMDYTVPVLTDFALMSVWAPMIRVLADGLGLNLSEITTTTDRRELDETITVKGMGNFEAGTQGAFRFEVTGLVEETPLLVVEHVTRIDDRCAPDWPRPESSGGFHQVIVAGRPTMKVTVHCEDPAEPGNAAGGNAAAANRIVNAIPAVCGAQPGPIHPLDLPMIISSGQVTTK